MNAAIIVLIVTVLVAAVFGARLLIGRRVK